MADIELVIKIDESKLWSLKNEPIKENFNIYELASYIDKGVPLPKGHGRLIDADNIILLALKEKTLVLKDTDLIDIRSREFVIDYLFKDIKNYINNMPTIIEADKGESEDNT